MSSNQEAIHKDDLIFGKGLACARCGHPARGAAQIGEDPYCHPSCDCHADCYRMAVLYDGKASIFDNGGTLPVGLNQVRNNTGHPIPLRNLRGGAK